MRRYLIPVSRFVQLGQTATLCCLKPNIKPHYRCIPPSSCIVTFTICRSRGVVRMLSFSAKESATCRHCYLNYDLQKLPEAVWTLSGIAKSESEVTPVWTPESSWRRLEKVGDDVAMAGEGCRGRIDKQQSCPVFSLTSNARLSCNNSAPVPSRCSL